MSLAKITCGGVLNIEPAFLGKEVAQYQIHRCSKHDKLQGVALIIAAIATSAVAKTTLE